MGKTKQSLSASENASKRSFSIPSRKSNKEYSDVKERIAYDILLSCASSNPVADAHNPDIKKLPEHWVPTMIANLTRAASGKFGPKEKAAYTRPLRKFRPAKLQEHTEHVLPRLVFQNPWPSFRAPGLKEMSNGGLKWGLPNGYMEGGGKGKYRGGKIKVNKRITKERSAGAQLGLSHEWDQVKVNKPDWGWPQQQPKQDWIDDGKASARVTWLGHATTLLQLPPLRPEEEALEESTEANSDAQPQPTPPNGNAAPADAEGAEANGDEKKPTGREPREKVGSRSINILFDPIFSERCSPSQSAGPQRFTPTPCKEKDLPPIDFICISHSHFDHLDYRTMKHIRRQRGKRVHAFVGLGLKERIVSFGWDPEQVSELDWWDSAVLQVHPEPSVPAWAEPTSMTEGSKLISQVRSKEAKLRIVCTPAQHGSGRGAGDKDATLWASWVVEWLGPEEPTPVSTTEPSRATFRAFFAGDTGLKYHHDNVEKRARYPACPAFEMISRRVGRPDLLLLPISVGSSLSYFRSWDPFPRAYSPFPRVSSVLTSSIHMDAYDAVETHEIMRTAGSERQSQPVSLAVHYGTFVRNHHQTEADVRDLRKACVRSNVPFRRTKDGRFSRDDKNEKGVFLVSNQGETVWLPMEIETE